MNKILVSLETHFSKQVNGDSFVANWYDESQPLNYRREHIEEEEYYLIIREYKQYKVKELFVSGTGISYEEYDIDRQSAELKSELERHYAYEQQGTGRI